MSGATIRLSPELTARIERRIEDTEFESPEEYVTFVLEEVVDSDGDDESEAAAEAPDRSDLEDRLEDLGYL